MFSEVVVFVESVHLPNLHCDVADEKDVMKRFSQDFITSFVNDGARALRRLNLDYYSILG